MCRNMMIRTSWLIAGCLALLALCVGVIAVSFNPEMLRHAAAHLDASDALLGSLLIAFSAASASYSG